MEFPLQCCQEWGGIKEGFADLFMSLGGTEGTPSLASAVSLLIWFSLPVTARAQPFLLV